MSELPPYRAPPPVGRVVPAPSACDPSSDAIERRMMDDILRRGSASVAGGMLLGKPSGLAARVAASAPGHVGVARNSPAASTPATAAAVAAASPSPSASSSGGGRDSLTVSLLQRVQAVEESNKRLRGELVAREREVFDLKHQCTELADAASLADTLQEDNDRLRAEIADMHAFLRDYGLTWVGGSRPASVASAFRLPATEAATAEAPAAHAPTADAHSNSATEAVGNAPYKLQEGANKAASGDALHSHDGVGGGVPPLLATDIDFPVLLLRLSQLNALVGAGKAHIVKRGGVHKFETPVGTPFTLYANGFMLNRGPFEPYDSKRGRAFIQDILDGYFPSELQALHPSGLLLTVIDKSELTYQESSAAAATAAAVVSPSAVAAAAALGGASRAAVAIHSLAAVGEPDMPMGLREFLSALPARVVSPQGQVVDVRAGIASMLSEEEASSGGAPSAGGLGSNIVVADTAAECTALEVEGSPVQTFSTLQIKSTDGQQTLLVKLPSTATVGDVRRVVDRHRASMGPYELRTAYPRRLLDNEAETLAAARLAPSGILHLRPIAAA